MKKKFWNFSLIISIFLINFAFVDLARASVDNITKLVIISAPTIILQNVSSSPILVQLQTVDNVATSTGVSATHLVLTSSLATGVFMDSSAGTCGNISSTKILTINSNWTQKYFCYLDSNSGTPTITVSSQEYPSWTPATQTITINPISLPESPATNTDSTSSPPTPPTATTTPPEATTTPPISASSTPPEATTIGPEITVLNSSHSSGIIIFGQVLGTSTTMIIIKEKNFQLKINSLKKRLDLLGVKLNDLKILIARQPVRPVKLVWEFW